MHSHVSSSLFFFFNDTATTEIYTLSLHDALPILLRACGPRCWPKWLQRYPQQGSTPAMDCPKRDRKSTRLNSSHSQISYAVFCLKKKNTPTSVPKTSRSRHRRRTKRDVTLLADLS